MDGMDSNLEKDQTNNKSQNAELPTAAEIFLNKSAADMLHEGVPSSLPQVHQMTGFPDSLPTIETVKTPEVTWRRFFIETLQTVLLALLLYFAIDMFVARVRVENVSMLPTLIQDEFVLVNKFAYKLGEIKHNDIIVFHHNAEEDYIKRVIGLPGDRVVIKDGKVFINDQQLNEPFIAAPPVRGGEWVVPEGKVFVLGDNRNQSSDSREWGFVSNDVIIGRAIVVYWPLNKFHLLQAINTVKAQN
jgi:signal peptidase I